VRGIEPGSIGSLAGRLAAAASCFVLASCAHVPVIDEAALSTNPAAIQVYGARGPLSLRQSKAILDRLAAEAPDAGALQRHMAIEQALAETPLVAGNKVKILRDGAETFPAMFEAIRTAQRYVYLEYYIFEDVSSDGQDLADLLIERRRAGVRVAILYDGVGSIGTPNALFDRLRQAGIQVVQFNPLNPFAAGWRFSFNDRDHRKMLIADGERVILGGVNLSSTYQSGPSSPSQADTGKPHELWRDTDLSISGPVVKQFERLFRQHWLEHDGPALGEEGPVAEADGKEVVRILGSAPKRLVSRYYVTLLSAIRNAETSVWITTAYFVPTHQEKEALIKAARRGVDVRLLLPSHSDSSAALQVQHSHYSDLLEAGVRIYERDADVLHSKTIVVDHVWSMVGSSNFDHRSVLFNDEVDAIVIGQETGSELSRLFESDLASAHPIDLAAWRRRPTGAKLREQFWRLWEKLL
jgi:cardiolipin synthase A/B